MPPPKMTANPIKGGPFGGATGGSIGGPTGGVISPTNIGGFGGPGGPTTGFGGPGGADTSQTFNKPPIKTIPGPNQIGKPTTAFPTNPPKIQPNTQQFNQPTQGFNQPPPKQTQQSEEPVYVDPASIPSKSRVVYDTLQELLNLIEAIEVNCLITCKILTCGLEKSKETARNDWQIPPVLR